MYNSFNEMFSYMFIVWFIPITLLIIIVFSTYMIIRNKKSSLPIESEYSLNILNERFAKGEISEEEYIKKKDMIRSSRSV